MHLPSKPSACFFSSSSFYRPGSSSLWLLRHCLHFWKLKTLYIYLHWKLQYFDSMQGYPTENKVKSRHLEVAANLEILGRMHCWSAICTCSFTVLLMWCRPQCGPIPQCWRSLHCCMGGSGGSSKAPISSSPPKKLPHIFSGRHHIQLGYGQLYAQLLAESLKNVQ